MSLYEASAHLFYGHRIQRTGHRADPNPPLGEDCSANDYVETELIASGHKLPDWRSAVADKRPEAEISAMIRESNAMIEKLSFGCELVEMGGSDAEDMVIYAVVKESDKSCSSEDDHGGFGERVLKPEDMVKGDDWDARLRDFCALLGLPAESVAPRWTLSMRG